MRLESCWAGTARTLHLADAGLLPGRELHDRAEALARDERACALGDDHEDTSVEPPEGREVEVVVVEVRDEDDVEAGRLLEVERRGPAQVQDLLAQQRVGERPDAVQLDEDRRVPEPAHPVGHQANASRSPLSRSRGA